MIVSLWHGVIGHKTDIHNSLLISSQNTGPVWKYFSCSNAQRRSSSTWQISICTARMLSQFIQNKFSLSQDSAWGHDTADGTQMSGKRQTLTVRRKLTVNSWLLRHISQWAHIVLKQREINKIQTQTKQTRSPVSTNAATCYYVVLCSFSNHFLRQSKTVTLFQLNVLHTNPSTLVRQFLDKNFISTDM